MSEKFTSQVKTIPYKQEKVFEDMSDLNNLERVKDRVPEDRVKDFAFDKDTVSVTVAPVGQIKLRIVDRQEPKCIKFATEQSPVPFNLWVQLLPVTDDSCKMRLTLKADINPFIKTMVSKPLQDGLEKIADALAMVRYE